MNPEAYMNDMTVSQFITLRIDASGKTDTEIAHAIGCESAKTIQMIKAGTIKFPLNCVKTLADALQINPADLLRIVMTEYMPDTWIVIKEIMGQPHLTPGE